MPKVLIVDDDQHIVQGITHYLELRKWQVETAADGIEALKKVTTALDAIILDLSMPKMSGETTLREIRRRPEFDSICVLMLTGSGEIQSAVHAIRLGAYQYLEKPTSLPDLHKILIGGIALQKAHALRRQLLSSFNAALLFKRIRDIIAELFSPPELRILLLGAGSTRHPLADALPVAGVEADFIRRMAAQRHPILVSEPSALTEWRSIIGPASSVLAAPIVTGAGPVGVITLAAPEANAFDRNWVHVIAYFADLAGLAIDIGDKAERLVQAERDKRNQLAQMAREARHQFATPAQVIHMQATELLEKELSTLAPEVREHAATRVGIITTNVAAITRACDYLDDISRDHPIEKARFHLAPLLRVCGDEIRPELEAKHIRLTLATDDIEDEVLADEKRIRYSVQCLLKNAVEAIEDRRDQVLEPSFDPVTSSDEISIGVDATDPSYVTFRIRDTGSGISGDNTDRLFQPLFSTKRRLQPGGLGLFSVKRIVDRHDGRIQFQTERGKGTVFTVSLPRH